MEVSSNVKIDFIVVVVTIMLRCSLAESTGYFWYPAEFKYVKNQDFENIKHMQNLDIYCLPNQVSEEITKQKKIREQHSL